MKYSSKKSLHFQSKGFVFDNFEFSLKLSNM